MSTLQELVNKNGRVYPPATIRKAILKKWSHLLNPAHKELRKAGLMLDKNAMARLLPGQAVAMLPSNDNAKFLPGRHTANWVIQSGSFVQSYVSDALVDEMVRAMALHRQLKKAGGLKIVRKE